jgi:heme exporter protein B
MQTPGLLDSAFAILARDLKLGYRRLGELANPLVFFLVVATLFPLATSPEKELLMEIGPGIVWVAALLSSVLALDTLYRADMDDGTMEQMALSPQPLGWLLLMKTIAHWLVSGLPLVLLAPLVAQAFFMPSEAIPAMVASLALGTPTLSLIGSIGAALTAGLRRGGALVAMLVLPLSMPILIFGARATDLAMDGMDVTGPLNLLAMLMVGSLISVPFAAAAAIRVSLD